jgi:hypothetical protein
MVSLLSFVTVVPERILLGRVVMVVDAPDSKNTNSFIVKGSFPSSFPRLATLFANTTSVESHFYVGDERIPHLVDASIAGGRVTIKADGLTAVRMYHVIQILRCSSL